MKKDKIYNVEIYKSSPIRLLYGGFIRAVVLCVLMIIFAIVSLALVNGRYQVVDSIRSIYQAGYLFYIMGVGLIAGMVWSFISLNISVAVDEKNVIFTKRGESYEKFSIKGNHFDTFIENQTVCGIVIWVKRYLRIEGKLYACHNFSKNTFAQLGSYISMQQRRNEVKTEIEFSDNEELYLEKTAFRIPREGLLQEEKKRMVRIAVECLVVGGIMLAAWYFGVYRRADSNVLIVFLTAGGVMVVFVLLPIWIQVVRFLGYKKKLPANIVVDNSYLQIDEQRFDFSGIHMIQMTPVSYIRAGQYSLRRKIRIIFQKRVYEFRLGNTRNKELQYEDYGKLQEELIAICDHNDVRFILDL